MLRGDTFTLRHAFIGVCSMLILLVCLAIWSNSMLRKRGRARRRTFQASHALPPPPSFDIPRGQNLPPLPPPPPAPPVRIVLSPSEIFEKKVTIQRAHDSMVDTEERYGGVRAILMNQGRKIHHDQLVQGAAAGNHPLNVVYNSLHESEKECVPVYADYPTFEKQYSRIWREACAAGRVEQGCDDDFENTNNNGEGGGGGGGMTFSHRRDSFVVADAYLDMTRRLLLGLDLCYPPLPKMMFAHRDGLAFTMTTVGRLRNVEYLLTLSKIQNLPGHFIEAGVWRGGTSIYAAKAMEVLGYDRHTFVCDSFEGLPMPRSGLSKGEEFYSRLAFLGVSLENVRRNFCTFNISVSATAAAASESDSRHTKQNKVHFIKGFFNNSMPGLRQYLIEKNMTISVFRLDGDMYESTIDLLYNLYDLVDVGGYIIIDDFGFHFPRPKWLARSAVMDFRKVHDIEDIDHTIVDIDGTGAYWRKARQVPLQRDRYPADVKPAEPVTMDHYRAHKNTWMRNLDFVLDQENAILMRAVTKEEADAHLVKENIAVDAEEGSNVTQNVSAP